MGLSIYFSLDYHVGDLVESKDRLFADICDNLNPDNEFQLLQKKQLNIRTITRDKLIKWFRKCLLTFGYVLRAVASVIWTFGK